MHRICDGNVVVYYSQSRTECAVMRSVRVQTDHRIVRLARLAAHHVCKCKRPCGHYLPARKHGQRFDGKLKRSERAVERAVGIQTCDGRPQKRIGTESNVCEND